MERSETLNNKKTIRAWAFFDWANSSYSLVISTAIFPAYYASLSVEDVDVLGISMSLATLYSFAISAAYLLIATLSPILSGIADSSGRKMMFMKFFTALGSISCILLIFFTGIDRLAWGTIFFMLATIGFSGALVFYNAYLPQIASEDQYDKVSAKGFSYGYIGSVLLLLINLVVIVKPDWFGIQDDGFAIRISFLMVGLWWIGFALIPFKALPKDSKSPINRSILTQGFSEIKKVWQQIKTQKNIRRFLYAFFCYSAGVQTVLFLASTFAEAELEFAFEELIAIILILQILAIGGAYLFANLSERKGNKFSLIAMLLIWIVICFLAFFVVSKVQFFAIAALVGLVMGGIQSLSRSTYSKLIPENTSDTTSYFSFYDILEKMAIVLGTFTFGMVGLITDNLRNSVLALAVFFVIGLLIMSRVKIQHIKTKKPLA